MQKRIIGLGLAMAALLPFAVAAQQAPSAASPPAAPSVPAAAVPAPAIPLATGAVVLPKPDPLFQGVIQRNEPESKAAYAPETLPPKGAPNILLVMTDDVGFAASSTFGGDIPTPNLDQLASRGLRYNRFHTTAMCSPTRAALLTGMNPHAVGNGIVTDQASGFPGYNGVIPHNAVSLARVLRDNGYSTAMWGKHHNVARLQNSQAGPFTQWPTGLGFDYFYGFIGAETDQFRPKLYRNTQPVAESTDKDYILDRDLADDLIRWVRNQKAAAPDRPFFAYLAPGTAHAPHQAPKEWIAKFKGKFDKGWDQLRQEVYNRQKAQGVIPADAELTPRPAQIPAWDSLSPVQRKVYGRLMEVYAGMLAHQDYQFGRIVESLRQMGQLDNTLVFFIQGDNGASGEGHLDGTLNEMGHLANRFHETPEEMATHLDEMGGPDTHEHYPIGWALAMDTPFQWVKQIASHLGGIRNGVVVSWPGRIKPSSQMRSQFHHVADVFPTLLEVAGIQAPTVVDGVPQRPIDGVSMAYTFTDGKAPDRRHLQYFELMGNRSVYQDGWMANTKPRRLPFELSPRPGDWEWELYDLNSDYSQARNLAGKEPARLKAMEELWWKEAERNNVLPVDGDMQSKSRADSQTTLMAQRRNHYEYTSGGLMIANDSAPFLGGRSFSIATKLHLAKKHANGVLVASGSRFGGWSFYLVDGRPVALHAFSHRKIDQFRVAAKDPIPPGDADVRFDFDYDGGGMYKGGNLRISVNGKEVASGRVERTIIVPISVGETFDIGLDTGVTVSKELKGEGVFDGRIDRVTVDLGRFFAPARIQETHR